MGGFRHAPPVAWLPWMVAGHDGGVLLFESIAGVDASLLVEDDGDGVAFFYFLLRPLVGIFLVGGGVGLDHLGGEDAGCGFFVEEGDGATFFCQGEHAREEIVPSLVADKGEAVGYAVDGVDDRAEGVVFSDDGGGGCGGDVRFFFLAADGQGCEHCKECYSDDGFLHDVVIFDL